MNAEEARTKANTVRAEIEARAQKEKDERNAEREREYQKYADANRSFIKAQIDDAISKAANAGLFTYTYNKTFTSGASERQRWEFEKRLTREVLDDLGRVGFVVDVREAEGWNSAIYAAISW